MKNGWATKEDFKTPRYDSGYAKGTASASKADQFNPEQPRAENGQFGEGSGGSHKENGRNVANRESVGVGTKLPLGTKVNIHQERGHDRPGTWTVIGHPSPGNYLVRGPKIPKSTLASGHHQGYTHYEQTISEHDVTRIL